MEIVGIVAAALGVGILLAIAVVEIRTRRLKLSPTELANLLMRIFGRE